MIHHNDLLFHRRTREQRVSTILQISCDTVDLHVDTRTVPPPAAVVAVNSTQPFPDLVSFHPITILPSIPPPLLLVTACSCYYSSDCDIVIVIITT